MFAEVKITTEVKRLRESVLHSDFSYTAILARGHPYIHYQLQQVVIYRYSKGYFSVSLGRCLRFSLSSSKSHSSPFGSPTADSNLGIRS